MMKFQINDFYYTPIFLYKNLSHHFDVMIQKVPTPPQIHRNSDTAITIPHKNWDNEFLIRTENDGRRELDSDQPLRFTSGLC